MSGDDRFDYEGVKAPSMDWINENELARMHLLRPAAGDADPPPTCDDVLALRMALMGDWRPEVRRNARQSHEMKAG